MEDVATLLDVLPTRIIINGGPRKDESVYRLTVFKHLSEKTSYIVRYSLQTIGKGQKRIFSSEKYCFSFSGNTLYEAVRLMYDHIMDAEKRGYLRGDFDLKEFLKDNPNPCGSADIDMPVYE